jgi:hypothetical protein
MMHDDIVYEKKFFIGTFKCECICYQKLLMFIVVIANSQARSHRSKQRSNKFLIIVEDSHLH